MSAVRSLTLPLLLVACASGQAWSAVLRVDADAVGAGNGNSWANAYPSLQGALAAAQPGDQLWVAAGVYKPGAAGDRNAAFVIPSGVTLYGGFAGNETTLAQRDWQANPTVLSGDIDGNDTVDATGVTTAQQGSNSFHVLRASNVSATTRIDGFTVCGGNAGASDAGGWLAANPDGGGLLNEGGTPQLKNLRFVQNGARHGGGLHSSAAVSLEAVRFEQNFAWQNGGGAFLAGSGTQVLKQVRFQGNWAWSDHGGGLHCKNSGVAVQDGEFFDNTSKDHAGGGFSGLHCPAIFLRARFENNVAGGAAIFEHGGGGIVQRNGMLVLSEVSMRANKATLGDGGAVLVQVGEVLIEKSQFESNLAMGMGGAVSLGGSGNQAIVRNSAFRGNVAKGDTCINCFIGDGGGGALALDSGIDTTVVSTLFSGNAAPNGGAIYNGAAPFRELKIINATFSGNYAYPSWDPNADPDRTGKGGALLNGENRSFVHNSVFWNNQDRSGVGTHRASIYNIDGGAEINNGGNQLPSSQEVTISDSLVQGCKPGGVWTGDAWTAGAACGIDGGGNLSDTDPNFVAATPVGDPTGSLVGDAHLQLGSPALNQGNNLLLPAGATTDLDGHPRIAAVDVDLGAYELATCPAGRVLHVTTTGAGLRDGSSWANATDDLSYALGVALRAQCQVWVAKGSYRPAKFGDRTASFRLKNLLAVYGGFVGTETQLAQRDWVANPTILTGDIGIAGDTGDNSLHVVRADLVSASAVLDGFTIRDGRAQPLAAPQDGYGAGVLMNSSSATLRNLVIRDNSADGFGGGLYKTGPGQPLLENVRFEANSAGTKGGGLHTDNGNLTLRKASFVANLAGQDGGGLSAWSGDVNGSQLRIVGNSAGLYGGGLLFAAQGKLTNVEIAGNYAGARGGGAQVQGTLALTLTNASVTGNRAGTANGGLRQSGGTLLLQNSFLWNNREAGVTGSASANLGQSGATSVRYSMLQGCKPAGTWNANCGTDGGFNLADANPLLIAPLAPTLAPGTAGDHRLQAASPLRNKGDNGALPGEVTSDLAGLPRIVGGVVDHGAYEVQ